MGNREIPTPAIDDLRMILMKGQSSYILRELGNEMGMSERVLKLSKQMEVINELWFSDRKDKYWTRRSFNPNKITRHTPLANFLNLLVWNDDGKQLTSEEQVKVFENVLKPLWKVAYKARPLCSEVPGGEGQYLSSGEYANLAYLAWHALKIKELNCNFSLTSGTIYLKKP